MRSAIYVRISLDRAGVSESPQRQIEACRARAVSEGWNVVEVIEDRDLSAFNRRVQRPGYERAMQLAGEHSIDALIVWKVDRLLRRARDMETWIDLCEDGLRLVSLNDGIDSTTATGRMTMRLFANLAQMASEETSARVSNWHHAMAEQGRPVGYGKRPYGLTAGYKEIIPVEADAIRDAADRLLGGQSLNSIVGHLIDNGPPTASGRPWRTSSLRNILRNPRIAGLRASKGIVTAEGSWPAILDRDTYAQVVALLDDPARLQPLRGVPHLLRGVMKCGRCGSSLVCAKTNGNSAYKCPPRTLGGCGACSIRGATADDYVTGRVLVALTSAEAVQPRPIRIDPAEIELIEGRMKELANDYALGLLERDDYVSARSAATARVFDLRAAREHERRVVPARLGLEVIGTWTTWSIPRQREIILSVIERATLTPAGRGHHVPVKERLAISWRN